MTDAFWSVLISAHFFASNTGYLGIKDRAHIWHDCILRLRKWLILLLSLLYHELERPQLVPLKSDGGPLFNDWRCAFNMDYSGQCPLKALRAVRAHHEDFHR